MMKAANKARKMPKPRARKPRYVSCGHITPSWSWVDGHTVLALQLAEVRGGGMEGQLTESKNSQCCCRTYGFQVSGPASSVFMSMSD